MLERLTIKNIALIHNQTIEFGNGLIVITGETGAGKSLIIDSLSLLLGEKADKTLISTGEDFASVEAVFTDISQQTKKIMIDLGLEDEEVIIITRKLSKDGKNECKVNGQTFTLSMLRRLSAPLMDLHGQFQHQNLMKVQNHLMVLDKFGGAQVLSLRDKYQELYKQIAEVDDELENLISDDAERQRLLDLYKFQIDEIDEAAFYDGEEEELKEFRNQVLHQEKIIDTLNSVLNICAGDGYEYAGLKDTLKKAENMLGSISEYSKDFESLISRIDSLKLELEDVSDTLAEKRDNMNIDEYKAKQNEERLDLLSSFKKKYGPDIKSINEYRDKISVLYENYVGAEERVKKLNDLKQQLYEQIIKIAKELSEKRKNTAKNLENAIKTELIDLGMKNSDFVVNFNDLSFDQRNLYGFDDVEFMFSANLGEPVKPLKNIASGGEMSRLMLAVKNITAKLDGIGTLIFDEIDTGVSGRNALTLAKKLSMVSRYAQVICVTHLAQVASFGDMNYLIEKVEEKGRTHTTVKHLTGTEKRQEIARLVSGNVTENSLKSAEELIDDAENFKKNIN